MLHIQRGSRIPYLLIILLSSLALAEKLNICKQGGRVTYQSDPCPAGAQQTPRDIQMPNVAHTPASTPPPASAPDPEPTRDKTKEEAASRAFYRAQAKGLSPECVSARHQYADAHNPGNSYFGNYAAATAEVRKACMVDDE